MLIACEEDHDLVCQIWMHVRLDLAAFVVQPNIRMEM